VPQAHALVREGPVNPSGDPDQGIHQRGAGLRIKLPYVIDVRPWDDQYMSGIVLPRIDKGDGQVILVNEVARRTTGHDLAEDALAAHHPSLPAAGAGRT
jgi:hypothetical protein